jgi:hypothetical protein
MLYGASVRPVVASYSVGEARAIWRLRCIWNAPDSGLPALVLHILLTVLLGLSDLLGCSSAGNLRSGLCICWFICSGGTRTGVQRHKSGERGLALSGRAHAGRTLSTVGFGGRK